MFGIVTSQQKSGAIKITLDAPPVALRLLRYEVAPLALCRLFVTPFVTRYSIAHCDG
jgi:hypothetical protein